MIRLNSSAIEAVDYNERTGDLTIYFHQSGGYTFHKVPYAVFAGLVTARSAGSYYNTHIRGRYA